MRKFLKEEIVDLLETDEPIVLHSALKPRDLFVNYLYTLFLFFILGFGFVGLWCGASSLGPEDVPAALLTYTYLGFFPMAVLFLYQALSAGEAVLTNRRLLRRQGLFNPSTTELKLDYVKEVLGLKSRFRPIVVVANDGWGIMLEGLPNAEEIGWAVAKASGLSMADEAIAATNPSKDSAALR